MFDKFKVKITILASLIITAYCFFNNIDFLRTCYSIIFTIIIFYFFGGIAEIKLKAYIEKIGLIEKQNNLETQDEIEASDDNISDDENENNFSEGIIINGNDDENAFEDNDDFYDNIDFDKEKEIF